MESEMSNYCSDFEEKFLNMQKMEGA